MSDLICVRNSNGNPLHDLCGRFSSASKRLKAGYNHDNRSSEQQLFRIFIIIAHIMQWEIFHIVDSGFFSSSLSSSSLEFPLITFKCALFECDFFECEFRSNEVPFSPVTLLIRQFHFQVNTYLTKFVCKILPIDRLPHTHSPNTYYGFVMVIMHVVHCIPVFCWWFLCFQFSGDERNQTMPTEQWAQEEIWGRQSQQKKKMHGIVGIAM